ncbi:MAG: hypothetical protein IK095_05210 [Oscillospiraceae bacterium]|nr:hypothetical protein [Oscillospiraceae bacterium]
MRVAAREPRKKREEIRVVGYLILEDGRTVPMDEITPEERERWIAACQKRLSQRMSDYYTQHPEEYARLCGE